MDEVQVEVKSSQVKLRQISKFVFLNKIGVYLFQFLGEFNGVIFVFVDCLELPKISIKSFVIRIFRGSFGNFVTKVDGLTKNLVWA